MAVFLRALLHNPTKLFDLLFQLCNLVLFESDELILSSVFSLESIVLGLLCFFHVIHLCLNRVAVKFELLLLSNLLPNVIFQPLNVLLIQLYLAKVLFKRDTGIYALKLSNQEKRNLPHREIDHPISLTLKKIEVDFLIS